MLASRPSAITARWSSDTTNQSVTTPMIVLDLSGTTHLSAGHNVALSQSISFNQAVHVNTESQSTYIIPQNTNTLMLKAVNKSSTRTSTLNSTSTDLNQELQIQFAQLASSLVSTTTAGTTSKVQKNQITLRSDLSNSFNEQTLRASPLTSNQAS
ncbi:charged multivesicular body protein 1 [Dorcoceras hygrometricum]|uniref:Charged multivesicular body protein 1 n=1 Tax=Dorcoceras hygrometricum TaxID=472368 RepID=A0A2Z7CCQ6_9LAMI|nr:charged multivesicular body protein 1 [Dorcoceras hygrometricum]